MKNKNKHDHKLTKFLKVFIFMLVMLAPFLAITTSCMTTYWNETIEMPYQEVNVTNQLQTNEVNSVDDLVVGNIYDFYIDDYHYTNANIRYFRATRLYNMNISSRKMDMDAFTNGVQYLSFIESPSHYLLDSYTLTSSGKNDMIHTKFQFVYYSDFNADYISQVSAATWIPQGEYEIVEHDTNDLNVFYYAIDQIKDHEIFNWTENTMIYSAVNNMTNGLGLTDNTLSILITYWTIITSIYIIIDIVLEMFIFLTHWLNDKIC